MQAPASQAEVDPKLPWHSASPLHVGAQVPSRHTPAHSASLSQRSPHWARSAKQVGPAASPAQSASPTQARPPPTWTEVQLPMTQAGPPTSSASHTPMTCWALTLHFSPQLMPQAPQWTSLA